MTLSRGEVFMDFDLVIDPGLTIPDSELSWTFSRSSGAGGQNVNKVESAVGLSWCLEDSKVIGPFRKRRMADLYRTRIVDGCLRVFVSDERSQFLNRQLAVKRMVALIRAGIKPPPPRRKKTAPSLSSRHRRLESKKKRGRIKKSRQSPPLQEE